MLDYLQDIEEVVERVLFVSNWPGPMVPDIGDNVEALRRLERPDAVVDLILRGTAEELYGL
ncbi:amidohydrolase family protein [Halegenticoccus tardaugens]